MKTTKTSTLIRPTNPIKRTGPGPKIHPGVILKKHYLDGLDLTQREFAQRTGLPVSRINDILKGRRGITMDAAIRLGTVLGTTEQLWLNLQASYDRHCAMEAKGAEYAALRPLNLAA
jgi:addiction module HigA family antidote